MSSSNEGEGAFAEPLRTVGYGETVAIARHGRIIAHLSPAQTDAVARRKEAADRFRGRRRRRRIEMSTDEILAARREGRRR